jgi:hypothetical protein
VRSSQRCSRPLERWQGGKRGGAGDGAGAGVGDAAVGTNGSTALSPNCGHLQATVLLAVFDCGVGLLGARQPPHPRPHTATGVYYRLDYSEAHAAAGPGCWVPTGRF